MKSFLWYTLSFYIEGYDEINLHVIQKLREILQEVRAVEGGFRLENSVQSMDENVLDANILNLAGDILIKCIITLHANSSDYDPKEFSSRLVSYKNKAIFLPTGNMIKNF